jgi:hypothetical protein
MVLVPGCAALDLHPVRQSDDANGRGRASGSTPRTACRRAGKLRLLPVVRRMAERCMTHALIGASFNGASLSRMTFEVEHRAIVCSPVQCSSSTSRQRVSRISIGARFRGDLAAPQMCSIKGKPPASSRCIKTGG